MNQINRRLIKPEEQYPYSILDINLLKEQESNFSFKGIFKKKDSSDSTEVETDSATSEPSGGGGKGILSGLLNVAGGLVSILPALGIGSKSRIAESNAQFAAQETAQEAQRKQTEQLFMIGGTFLLVIVISLVLIRR